MLEQMNNISKLLTKYNRRGMHFNVLNFWDYGVSIALKWVLAIKLSDTENDCMSYYHLFDF